MVIKNPYLTIIEKNIVVLEPESVISFAQDLRSESDYGKTVSVFLQSLIRLESLFYQEKRCLFDKNLPLIRNLPPELRVEMIIFKNDFSSFINYCANRVVNTRSWYYLSILVLSVWYHLDKCMYDVPIHDFIRKCREVDLFLC